MNITPPLILIAEDNPMLQELYLDAFTERGINIIQAFDGLAAWDAIKHRSDIDMAIVDLGLPELSGSILLQEIEKRRNQIPVLVVSGFTDQEGHLDQLAPGKAVQITKGSLTLRQIVDGVEAYFRSPR